MTDRDRFRGQDTDHEFSQEDFAGQDETTSSSGYDDSMGFDESLGYDEAVGYDEMQDQGGRMPHPGDEYTSERDTYHGQDAYSAHREDEYDTHEEELGSGGAEGGW
ncbi:hypothetical protein [Actinomadura sp.]|uniref:hypothetical protein n=2 Tax=Actinomadura sp. TaxID=1989 RepID=UPI0037CB0E62